MTRRGLLLLAAAPAAAADAEFPAALEPGAGMPRLVLNGTGARLWSPLRIEVYRAALYLEAPSCDAAAILASSRPRLIEARYRRAVPLEGVVAAWEEALGAPLPGPFRDWLRPIAAGDVERQLVLADAAVLEGPGRPPRRVPGADFARRLLAAWIGPAAPTGALRRGLLGGAAACGAR
jgi:hypothetical protein